MENQKKHYEQYCEQMHKQSRDCLQLLKSIAETEGDGNSKREAVLEYCREYSVGERTIWHYLISHQKRKFSLNDQPDAIFHAQDEYLREQIISLIPRLAQTALSDFKKLLSFTISFLDRMTYLSDWLLNSFLSKANKKEDPVLSSVQCADQLVTKLDKELLALCESIVINTIGVIERSYRK